MALFPIGPSGGSGGGHFDDLFDQLGGFNGPGPTGSITRLQVNAGATLDHLQVSYQSGSESFGPFQHGASGGGFVNPAFDILIDQGQRLQKIDGWLDVFDGTFEVRGLQFTLTTPGGNVQSGVFGAITEKFFFLEAPPGGEIIALWGNQGLFLDALGVWVRVP